MRAHTILFTCATAVTAALGACTDSSEPVAVTPGVQLSRKLACAQAPPDADIPLPIAPSSQRVDLVTPVFSHPTLVTNPLFPIGLLSQVVLVGAVDGVPLRVETTLLPGTNSIDLGDRDVETLTSQYIAYLDRRIHEVALDWYAQADDGAVWYLGEDVFNYEDGEIADTDGTWLACQDGPAAMIMPAHPQVGNVFRPENVWPLVFEEVTVQARGQTVDGPRGPVAGAILVQELHMDGEYEDKTFAPGYGEFSTGAGANLEALALAIPTDAVLGPPPAELRALLTGARQVFHATGSEDWASASQTVRIMNAAWANHPATGTPRLLGPLMAQALDGLTQAVAAREPSESRQAAVDVTRIGLDFLLQYRSLIVVDFARLDLWVRQLVIDAEAEDAAGVQSDVAILERVLERLEGVGDKDDRQDARRARSHLGALMAAANRGAFAALLDAASRLEELLHERALAAEAG